MLGTFMVVSRHHHRQRFIAAYCGQSLGQHRGVDLGAHVIPGGECSYSSLTGWLANYFGRKRLLLISVVGFTTASFLCGLSVNLPMLIVCRIIQGMTGGVMQPISQAIMLEAFPPRERGKAMAFFGIGIVVAPIIGPVLGGWLTDAYSWRWVFYVNIPFGALSLFMTSSFIFDPHYIRRASARIDSWGSACWRSASARCRSGWTRGSVKTGGPPPGSPLCW